MRIVERKLEKYTTESGKCPFEDWFNDFKDKKTQAVVDARLTRLRLGNLGKYRELGEGVKELKINFGGGLRVYFAEASGMIVILLCGGDKGSQDRDIKKAKNYWEDYQGRMKND